MEYCLDCAQVARTESSVEPRDALVLEDFSYAVKSASVMLLHGTTICMEFVKLKPSFDQPYWICRRRRHYAGGDSRLRVDDGLVLIPAEIVCPKPLVVSINVEFNSCRGSHADKARA